MITTQQSLEREKKSKPEFYRQIEEGFKAMQEGRETLLDDVIEKIKKRRAEHG